MSVKCKNYYTTPTENFIAPVNSNLVLGHPEEYTSKFYKNLSIMVNPSTNLLLNGNEIFVHKALGLHLTADKDDPIYDFRVLDSNVQIFYMGSW